jgi:magnesium chelatase subunit D
VSTSQIQTSAPRYPFAAIVGQDPLKEALLRLAVDPSIGGLLVSGTRGTAKSTAVRALADLLPPIPTGDGATMPTPFVELPVGAAEDRVIGNLDVRLLLAEAERRFEPGLLARAHRGILYADEVNLLPDHLVDVILDAAASGVNVVERDGVSFAHEARIMLVGTMNPEEGELRPQLLDRFGLCVAIENDDDLDRRVEIIERRMAFERDPLAFANAYESRSAALRERVVRARELLEHVALDRACLRRAAELAIEANVEGMRADLTIVRTARAITAFEDRTIVTLDDIERAAHSALAHRRRDAPRGAPPRPPAAPPPPPRTGNHAGSESADDSVKTFDVGAPVGLRLETSTPSKKKPCLLSSFTARGHGATQTPRGIARSARTTTAGIDALATIRAAAQDRTPTNSGTRLPIDARHMRFIERRGRERRLVVFLIDASGSMAAAARMRAAKGAVCSLLENAYHRRDMVALLAFRGENAELLVPPTRSAALAYRRLRTLPTGGRTPLAAGLRAARELLATHARRDPAAHAHLVIVSDAHANAPERDAFQAALREASLLRTPRVRSLCIDVESGRVRLGNVSRLAYALNATYQHLESCTERALGAAVREWAANSG